MLLDDAGTKSQTDISGRLKAVTSELREIEQLIKLEKIDARVLREFREAIDQQTQERHDPHNVLSHLAAERVRRMTQMAKDLCLDLDACEVSFQTEGIKDLHAKVNALEERLGKLSDTELLCRCRRPKPATKPASCFSHTWKRG